MIRDIIGFYHFYNFTRNDCTSSKQFKLKFTNFKLFSTKSNRSKYFQIHSEFTKLKYFRLSTYANNCVDISSG